MGYRSGTWGLERGEGRGGATAQSAVLGINAVGPIPLICNDILFAMIEAS